MRCEFDHCHFDAKWCAHWPNGERPDKHVCDWHKDRVVEFVTKRVPGLDPHPRSDPETFRPSLQDMMRHLRIAEDFTDARGETKDDRKTERARWRDAFAFEEIENQKTKPPR